MHCFSHDCPQLRQQHQSRPRAGQAVLIFFDATMRQDGLPSSRSHGLHSEKPALSNHPSWMRLRTHPRHHPSSPAVLHTSAACSRALVPAIPG